MRKKNIKYLSQSVLLEERNLPFAFYGTIMIIFLMIISFLFWSNRVVLNQFETFVGTLDSNPNTYEYHIEIPINLGELDGQNVEVLSATSGDTRMLKGTLNIQSLDSSGSFYSATVVTDGIKTSFLGDVVNVKVTTGSKTLLTQLLGPIYNMNQNAFQ